MNVAHHVYLGAVIDATMRFVTVLAGCIICSMDEELIKKVRSELARQGGLARAKALTPQQRRESAIKASKVAAKARTRAAKERRLAMTDEWERPKRNRQTIQSWTRVAPPETS